jgi:hypothetical protein
MAPDIEQGIKLNTNIYKIIKRKNSLLCIIRFKQVHREMAHEFPASYHLGHLVRQRYVVANRLVRLSAIR